MQFYVFAEPISLFLVDIKFGIIRPFSLSRPNVDSAVEQQLTYGSIRLIASTSRRQAASLFMALSRAASAFSLQET